MATPSDLFVKEMQTIMEADCTKEEIESRYRDAIIRYRYAQPSPYAESLRKRFQEARGNPVAFNAVIDDIHAYLEVTHKKAIEAQIKIEMADATARRLALQAVEAPPQKSFWSAFFCR